MNTQKIAEQISFLRRSRGLTQAELGERVDVSKIKNNFKYDKFKSTVLDYCNRHGIM